MGEKLGAGGENRLERMRKRYQKQYRKRIPHFLQKCK